MSPRAKPAPLTFLYTEIGRGHPAYLDGIAEVLARRRSGLVWRSESVFGLSTGLSKQFWKLARWLYRTGSNPGLLGDLYARLRQNGNYNQGGLVMALAGRDIKGRLAENRSLVLVAHPILVGLLANRPGLIYQHGEAVAPPESMVSGAEQVLVPTAAVADHFLRFGYKKNEVLVTGLCLEPALAAQAADAFELRLNRIAGNESLTGAFFSSGAEPAVHIAQLIRGAISLVNSGGRAVLFVNSSGLFAAKVLASADLNRLGVTRVSKVSELPADLPPVIVISSDSRSDENRLLAQLFSEFDFVVAPPHERCNYALGLGLPLFIIEPVFGSFAPLNLENVLSHKAGVKFGEAETFGSRLDAMRSDGRLTEMALAGWQRYEIDGYEQIVNWLIERGNRD